MTATNCGLLAKPPVLERRGVPRKLSYAGFRFKNEHVAPALQGFFSSFFGSAEQVEEVFSYREEKSVRGTETPLCERKQSFALEKCLANLQGK